MCRATVGDLYVETHESHESHEPAITTLPPAVPDNDVRRKYAIGICVCVTLVIMFIIVIRFLTRGPVGET
jgi:hypothetical protein